MQKNNKRSKLDINRGGAVIFESIFESMFVSFLIKIKKSCMQASSSSSKISKKQYIF